MDARCMGLDEYQAVTRLKHNQTGDDIDQLFLFSMLRSILSSSSHRPMHMDSKQFLVKQQHPNTVAIETRPTQLTQFVEQSQLLLLQLS